MPGQNHKPPRVCGEDINIATDVAVKRSPVRKWADVIERNGDFLEEVEHLEFATIPLNANKCRIADASDSLNAFMCDCRSAMLAVPPTSLDDCLLLLAVAGGEAEGLIHGLEDAQVHIAEGVARALNNVVAFLAESNLQLDFADLPKGIADSVRQCVEVRNALRAPVHAEGR